MGAVVKIRRADTGFWISGLTIVGALAWCLGQGDCQLLTADQAGYRQFAAGDYEAAATSFADPMWRGAALYRQKDYEQAAGVFAGFDTPESALNQGNSLVMLGKYDQAIARYERALVLRPDWEPALVNRDIARARADRLKSEGGEGTDGMLGADEIVFSDNPAPPSSGTEQTDESASPTEEELRSIWLRQVQTKPADFLRAKFAYQYATRGSSEEGDQ